MDRVAKHMANNPNSSDFTVGILGTGAMGRGIAQIMATGGMQVLLFDANEGAAEAGREFAERMILREVRKGRSVMKRRRQPWPVLKWSRNCRI